MCKYLRKKELQDILAIHFTLLHCNYNPSSSIHNVIYFFFKWRKFRTVTKHNRYESVL